jgi:probable rRNA maturation factor
MRKIGIFLEGNISFPYNKIEKKFFVTTAEKIFNIIEIDNISVNIILTDNKFIRSINKVYRKKNSPTDVISFAYRDDLFPSLTGEIEELGDVYISLEKASGQSLNYGVSLKDELKRLLIHGILHLLGYDHEISDEEEKKMSDMEDKIFNEI